MKKTKIALTGGIGSGKSTAAQMIVQAGFPVFSCDDIYRELSKEHAYVEKVERIFPGTTKQGKIDKPKLAQIVFNDQSALKKLDSLSHPLVWERLEKKMNEAESPLVFAEVPLLFESNFEERFDKIFVVLRKKRERIAAVVQRDGVNENCVIARINSQYDYERFSSANDHSGNIIVIKNNSDREGLKISVNAAINSLKSLL